MDLRSVKIDRGFRGALGKMSDDELAQLEANIIRDGEFTDPLVVWKEKGTLIDGYNRLNIWQTQIKDNYDIRRPKVVELSFETRAEVLDWIANHQIGRRNKSKHDIKMMQNERYADETAKRKSDRTLRRKQRKADDPVTESKSEKGHGDPKNVADTVAEDLGVSRSTVIRSKTYAAGAAALTKAVGKKLAEDVFSGKIPFTDNQISEFRRMEKSDIKQEVKVKVKKTKESLLKPRGGINFEPGEFDPDIVYTDAIAILKRLWSGYDKLNKELGKIAQGLPEEVIDPKVMKSLGVLRKGCQDTNEAVLQWKGRITPS